MSDIVFPVCMYFVDSILSGAYTRNFLKEKFRRRSAWVLWIAVYMLIQIFFFVILDNQFSFNEITGIMLNICILLSMQFLFFKMDLQKQCFIVFSFVAGRELVKHIGSVLSIAFTQLWNRIFDILLEQGALNTMDSLHRWIDISVVAIIIVDLLLYALLLFGYLFLISRKFIKKDYPLQLQETVFLILPCIAALCISVTIKILIISVEDGMTIMIYDTVPVAKFWVPFICVLLLLTILASVMVFQKLVAYNEETKKHAILENQLQQMQREITEIQDIYADMRGLRHDMRSHLENISLLVKEENGSAKKELQHYISKMEDTVKKLDFAYQTGNPITDIIIHQKGQEAEKQQIRFEVDFIYPSKLLIDVYDIAIILNNALENAIEACNKVDGQKQIRVHSYVKGSLFFIEIENDFCGAIVMEQESGLPVSGKKEKKLHGIGISNIQRCAKKYMGDIDIVISDTDEKKKFNLTVMMNGKPAVKH